MMRQQGFSLVEMAIVLVVSGLLVGGILVGQSLVRQSGVQGIATEQQQFAEAVTLFHEQYQALPGDYPLANHTFGTGYTNGDGNGRIENPVSSGSATNLESSSFWHHLDKAGFVPAKSSLNPASAELSTATSRTSALSDGAQWVLSGCPVSGTDTTVITDDLYNALGVHRIDLSGGVLEGREALGLDVKLDDGQARTGRVRVQKRLAGSGTCATIFPAVDSCTTATGRGCDIFFDINPRQPN